MDCEAAGQKPNTTGDGTDMLYFGKQHTLTQSKFVHAKDRTQICNLRTLGTKWIMSTLSLGPDGV